MGSGSQGGADARWVHGFAAWVGDVPLISDLLVFDLRQINPGSPEGIDGLLGQDFFRGRIVQIDFARRGFAFLSAPIRPALQCCRSNFRMARCAFPSRWAARPPGGRDRHRMQR